jgi:ribose transport system ATP-binding protein
MTAMLQGIQLSKTFVGIPALKAADFEVRPHEVVGLVGENGAGKSTLMRIAAGVQLPSSGTLLRDGVPLVLRSPREAADHGIAMVFQEQSLLVNMSVAENLFLGREQEFMTGGLINWRRLYAAARQQLAKVELDIDPSTRTSELSFAARQMLELAKALSLEDRISGQLVILLDEPTSVLERHEVELLFARVRALKQRASFVFVSHRLDEVLALSDRIYVMKDGAVVAEMPTAEASLPKLHRLMVGREQHTEFYRESDQEAYGDAVALQVRGLTAAGHYSDVDFDLHRGEVLGIAGVIGSGREELVRTLFGFLPHTAGTLTVGGTAVHFTTPADAVAHGIGYIPRERRVEGLVMLLSLASNMTLANLGVVMRHGLIERVRERLLAGEWMRKLSIRASGIDALCVSLSGGNQQKVVLAKWLTAGSRVLILDHPTRGLDVGAKEEVYRLVRDLCRQGTSVLLTADSLEETIGLSHTVLVMRDGRVTARFEAGRGAKPAQVDLIEHMV